MVTFMMEIEGPVRASDLEKLGLHFHLHQSSIMTKWNIVLPLTLANKFSALYRTLLRVALQYSLQVCNDGNEASGCINSASIVLSVAWF